CIFRPFLRGACVSAGARHLNKCAHVRDCVRKTKQSQERVHVFPLLEQVSETREPGDLFLGGCLVMNEEQPCCPGLTTWRRVKIDFGGEFDPGSGSTLAACLMHASRTGFTSVDLRGGRVRSTWVTCPLVGG